MNGLFGGLLSQVAQIDIGRGLLALVISVALFSVVEREQNPPEAQTFDVPIELERVPPGLVIVGEQTNQSAQVRLSAPREVFVSMRPSDVKASVDLSSASAGVGQYRVDVDVPSPRVRVVEVTPPRITVRLDEQSERPVPVRLNRIGTVPSGYEAGDATVEPGTVLITGPASLVRRIDAVTADLRLEGLTSDVDARYPVTPVDSQGQPVATERIRINPGMARVHVPITQQLSYKTVGIQPDIVGGVQSGYVIDGVTVEPAALTIAGQPRALAGVNFVTTEQIDVTDATATFARQVSVILPEGVATLQDGLVRVTVRISPIVLTQAYATVPVIENLTPGLQVTSSLPRVQVVLEGITTQLRGTQPGELRATVDLAGLGVGSHSVPVVVAPPPGLTVQSVSPSVVLVTIADTREPTSAPPVPQAPTATATATATSTAVPPRPAVTPRPSPTRSGTPTPGAEP
jgi:YbbR domain-containing protein